MQGAIIKPIKNKTISFCITCYDLDYHLLNNLLGALRSQTQAPDEIIISSSGVNNNNLYSGYVLIDNKKVPIVATNSEERHSEGEARNAGAKASSCDVIQFFDVDDIPHEQRVEFASKIFNTTECDALVHSYKTGQHYGFTKHAFEDSRLFECYWKPDNGLGGGQLRANDDCNIAHGPITVMKNVFDSISYSKDPRAADCKFCGNLILNNKKVFYYHEELMHYNL